MTWILTRVDGQAPYNAGGQVRIFNEGELLKTIDVDAAGGFKVDLCREAGNFLFEATGGFYEEPAGGQRVNAQGVQLRAAATGVEPFTTIRVVISPWTEMAVAATDTMGGYDNAMRSLASLLTCGKASLKDVLVVPPAAPTEGAAVDSLDSASLAYLYQGAWSQLAADLSAKAGVQPGARINSLSLGRMLAEDLAEGKITGTRDGLRIEMANDQALPPDVLRQPLAQAAYRFARSGENKTGVRAQSVADIFACLSKNTVSAFGPAGRPLDVQGPLLSVHAPSVDAVLTGEAPISCYARDESGLATVEAQVLKDGQVCVAPEGFSDRSLVLNDPDRAYAATLNTTKLEDGPYALRVEAVDTWGNVSTVTRSFFVNNRGGVPKLEIEATGDTLSKTVSLTCRCDDAHPQGCELDPKTLLLAGFVQTSATPTQSTYLWDTTAVFDGQYSLSCSSLSFGRAPVLDILTLDVRNTGPGRARGGVYLDGPVRHTKITAYAYEGARRGRILGSTEAPDGHFDDLTLAADYRGPVLFEAFGAAELEKRAEYRSAVLGQNVKLGAGRLTLLWDAYAPGDVISPLSINAATSLAEALATAGVKKSPKWAANKSFAEASSIAHRLIGSHLGGTASLDVRSEPVANLTGPHDQGHSATLLALFHIGLSRLAAEQALADNPSMPQSITAATLLDALREDLADGILDGKNETGRFVALGHRAILSDQTLRYDLAKAIERWLDNKGVDAEGQKNDQLTKQHMLLSRDFTRYEGFLPQLCESSALFNHVPGKRFDAQGPKAIITLLDRQRRPRSLEQPRRFGGTLELRAEATDPSRTTALRAFVGDKELAPDVSTAEMSTFLLDTARYPDGPLSVHIAVVDRLGNVAHEPALSLNVCNTPARLRPPQHQLWTNGDLSLCLNASSSLASCSLEGAPPGSDCVLADSNAAVQVSLTAFGADGAHTVAVIVEDKFGNTSRLPLDILVDTQVPVLTWANSTFVQERSGGLIQLDGTGCPVLQKRYDRFDWYKGYDAEEHLRQRNLPVLRFNVSDLNTTQTGTSDQDLIVNYRYRFRSRTGERVRDWEPLSRTEKGYILPLAYQSLLPQEILALSYHESIVNNFLARASVDDEHFVDLQVLDRAGNTAMVTVAFRLQILAPPVMLRCSFSPEMMTAHIITPVFGSPIRNIFRRGFEVSHIEAFWGDSANALSLAPSGSVKVALENFHAGTNVQNTYRHIPSDRTFEARCSSSLTGQQDLSLIDPQGHEVEAMVLSGVGDIREYRATPYGPVRHDARQHNVVPRSADGFIKESPYTTTFDVAGKKWYTMVSQTEIKRPNSRGLYHQITYLRDLVWRQAPLSAHVLEVSGPSQDIPDIVQDASCSHPAGLAWFEESGPLIWSEDDLENFGRKPS